MPLGQLAQTVEHLARFALFGLLLSASLRGRRSLGFVAILRVGKLELIELLLRAISSATSSTAAPLPIAADDFVLARTDGAAGGSGGVEASGYGVRP